MKKRVKISILVVVIMLAILGVMGWQFSKTNKAGSAGAVLKSLESKGFTLLDVTDNSAVDSMNTWANDCKVMRVDDELVYIYSVKFESVRAAELSAHEALEDEYSFLYKSHLYTSMNLMVFYKGNNEKIQKALGEVLQEYKK